MSESKGGNIIQMPCLGRPFTMGMLYDCRKDILVPGMTLWSNATLRQALDSKKQTAEGYEIIAEDTFESKAFNLDINANLKLSFLGGLVEVQGSAKYLNDRVSSMQQSRVSLKYWSTSRFDQLTMEQLGKIEFPEVISKKIATHVVVGVLYGADAFFVFDQKVEKGKNKQEVSGNMRMVLKKTLDGIADVQGGAKLKISAEDTKKANMFQCKYHGDLHLRTNPTTFDGAIKIYQELPSLMRDGDCSKVIAKKVWLYPLVKLDSNAATIIREISTSLINQAQDVMEETLLLENQTNDLLNTSVSSYFSGMQKLFTSFKAMISEYKLNFSSKLNQLLPKIREGGEEESELVDLLTQKHISPFASDQLSTWIKIKQQEIKVLDGYFQTMRKIESIELALSPGDLDKLVADINIEHVLCFSFNVTNSSDPFLQQLHFYLRNCKSSANEDVLSSSWLKDKKLMTSMRQKILQFTEFATANERSDERNLKIVLTDHSEENYSS